MIYDKSIEVSQNLLDVVRINLKKNNGSGYID